MSVSLKEMFGNNYVGNVVSGKKVKVYDDKNGGISYQGFLVNELLHYLISEGFRGAIGSYDIDTLKSLKLFMEKNNLKCVKDVVDLMFSKYVNEGYVKCMWIVMPKSVYDEMIKKYRSVKGSLSQVIRTKSFRIIIYYKSKLDGDDVYVGCVVPMRGYFKMYKDYLKLGGRVLCDDKWLSGRIFYGIKSDLYYLDRKIQRLKSKVRRLK